jgi:hypothetical protein
MYSCAFRFLKEVIRKFPRMIMSSKEDIYTKLSQKYENMKQKLTIFILIVNFINLPCVLSEQIIDETLPAFVVLYFCHSSKTCAFCRNEKYFFPSWIVREDVGHGGPILCLKYENMYEENFPIIHLPKIVDNEDK